jgi:CspA family cold shock protein
VLIYSLYTDGSSSGRSNKPIGWGWVAIRSLDSEYRQIIGTGYGGAEKGTNNIAELMAAKEALHFWAKYAKEVPPGPVMIELVSDSMYVLGLAKGEYSASKNQALAGIVREACKKFNVVTRWVEGHAGDPANEMCDRLAKAAKARYSDALNRKHEAVTQARVLLDSVVPLLPTPKRLQTVYTAQDLHYHKFTITTNDHLGRSYKICTCGISEPYWTSRLTKGHERGTVRWFNIAKGYGFVRPDDGGEDLYAYHTDILCEGFRTLNENARVTFVRTAGPKGYHATQIREIK